jgi:hypothetical protein
MNTNTNGRWGFPFDMYMNRPEFNFYLLTYLCDTIPWALALEVARHITPPEFLKINK